MKRTGTALPGKKASGTTIKQGTSEILPAARNRGKEGEEEDGENWMPKALLVLSEGLDERIGLAEGQLRELGYEVARKKVKGADVFEARGDDRVYRIAKKKTKTKIHLEFRMDETDATEHFIFEASKSGNKLVAELQYGRDFDGEKLAMEKKYTIRRTPVERYNVDAFEKILGFGSDEGREYIVRERRKQLEDITLHGVTDALKGMFPFRVDVEGGI